LVRGRERRERCSQKASQKTARIPAPPVMWRFAGFSYGRTAISYRPPVDRYRPPRRIPSADRPPGNELFCRAFSPPLVFAVDAVATFPAFIPGQNPLRNRRARTPATERCECAPGRRCTRRSARTKGGVAAGLCHRGRDARGGGAAAVRREAARAERALVVVGWSRRRAGS
jgi:hypothetical protein